MIIKTYEFSGGTDESAGGTHESIYHTFASFYSDQPPLSERLDKQHYLGRSDNHLTTYQRPQVSGARRLFHQFVRQVDTDDGIAWCSGIDRDNATLLYIDVPGAVEETRRVPLGRIRPATLSEQTRVWLPSKPFGWIPGEIVARPDQLGRYLVGVAGVGRIQCWPHQFRVRWNRPLGDPSVAVAHGFVEGREYYDARQPLLRNIVQQRVAYRGFNAAASATVLPYQHQLDVLSRVTGDPIMRFILADEVGLGKTVEAGLVMRQLLLDDLRASIVVLVPRVLVSQWIHELVDRLALDQHMDRVTVAPYEAIAEVMTRRPDLLVIDEAHRMSEMARRNPDLGRQLAQAAQDTSGLLLLTATPMHAGATGFLRLLNLIDPKVYRLDDVESFGRRLRMRQEQATKIELLHSHVPTRIVLQILREFKDDYGRDSQLLPLLEQAISSVSRRESDRELRLAAVAEHLRETYRISRRVIRHRRDAARTRGYPVSGRRPGALDLRDVARPVLDNFLDHWRTLLTRDQSPTWASRLFYIGTVHVLAGTGPALHFIRARLAGKAVPEVGVGATEDALLRNTAAELELLHGSDARADLVVAHVQAVKQADWKVLVFTSFTAQAHVLAEGFRQVGEPPEAIALHTSDRAPAERDDEVSRFQYRPECRVMVADSSAAEGRNFQMVDELIFLDLPLSPNALEQRIGRVDRFNLRAKPGGTRCTYLTEESSPWTLGLQHFLRNVTGVFDRSVATLQRPLADLETRVAKHLLSDGPSAFNIPAAEVEQVLADERVELDQLTEIEDSQFFTDFSDASFDDLLTFEDSTKPVEDAFRALRRPGGGIGIQVITSTRHADVFEFRLSDAGEGPHGLNAEERAMVKPLLPGKRTFDKLVAATQNGVRPARIGDPLVDWLADYLRRNERGGAIAMVTRTEHVPDGQLWIGFDYLIEFDDLALTKVGTVDRRRLRRRGDAFFVPRVETVWTDGIAEAPPAIRELLTSSGTNSQPLRGRTWQEVLPLFPDWAQRCAAAAALAAAIVRARPSVTTAATEAATLAAAEAARGASVMRARAALYPGQDIPARAASTSEQFQSGLRQPRSELLACTAIALLPANG
jgi:ATP-dependent helicase HepA